MLDAENKLQLPLVLFLLSLTYLITDASVPNCEDQSEKCQCHPSYDKYNQKSQSKGNVTSNCLKVFTKKLSWNLAHGACEREYSFLLQKHIDSSLHQDLRDQGIQLIWLGIKRIAGFYVSLGSNDPSVFKESNREWGRKWNEGEPVHDCVALNISSGFLVTSPCTTELNFVCQNDGFPIYPINETLACPDDWLFFYQLPFSRKKCIQVFKSNSPAEATRTCSRSGGHIADLEDYFKLHTYGSDSNNTAGSNSARNNTESCVTQDLLSIFSTAVRKDLNFNCTDKLFICEQDTKNVALSSGVVLQIWDAFASTDPKKDLLTCEVLLDGKNLNGTKKHILYRWFKNGIPISVDSYLFQVGFYSDPTKSYPLTENRQGTYSCGASVAGLSDTHISPEVAYFYSDVSTYILTLRSDALKYQDFSQLGFRKFKAKLKRSVGDFTKDLKAYFPKLLWDFQNFSSNGNVSTVQMLLYIKRNESLYVQFENETEVQQFLQSYITEETLMSKEWTKDSLSLRSADVCFSETVPSSQTAYEGDLLWDDTRQTRTAVSEPMCLNGWKLVTRECRASVIRGAEWQPFNYSSCSKYQAAVKGLKVNCPYGFRKLKPNICYSVNLAGYTFDEASKICRQSSSYLMNGAMLKTYMLSKLESTTSFWISGKLAFQKDMQSWPHSLHLTSSGKRSPIESIFHCTYATVIPFSYNISTQPCNKKAACVCIHHPLKFMNSYQFGKIWRRLPAQTTCYHHASYRLTWTAANDTCSSLATQSSLPQSIQHLRDYTLFKAFMQLHASPLLKGMLLQWRMWTNLMQEGDSLRWLPEQPVEFVDWSARTDFSMSRSAGLLVLDRSSGEVRWMLEDPSSKAGLLCEMQDCTIDTRPILVHIMPTEYYMNITEPKYGANIWTKTLRCSPSGWFVLNSIFWYKDGIPVLSNSDSYSLTISQGYSPHLEDIMPFQGYYWCSVDQEEPFERIHSSKVLIRLPYVHTFVLYTHSPDLSTDASDCSGYMDKYFLLPSAFVEHLNKTVTRGFQTALLRNISCERSEVHFYIHIYILEYLEYEDKILGRIESPIISSFKNMNTTIFDEFKLEASNWSLRSTVACPKDTVIVHNRRITWPATPIGQTALPEDLCVTDGGNAIERQCLGDFNTGAFWGPIQGECNVAPSVLTLNLHKLSKTKMTEANILNSSLNMDSLTSTSESLTPADVQYVAQILRNMATVSNIQPKVLSSVISTVDRVIGARRLRLDDTDMHSNVSSKISFAMENIVSNLKTNGSMFNDAGDNIAVSVLPIGGNGSLIPTGGILESWTSNLTTLFNGTDDALHSGFDTFEAGILLPENLLAKSRSGSTGDMAIIIHKNFHHVENIVVVSPVIDVSLGSMHVYNVNPSVEMIFKVEESDKNASFVCVFWDQNLNEDVGGWSYRGCTSHLLDSSHVQCLCDHLTSFAVILELRPGSEIPEIHQKTLSVITYIGCALSIFGLGTIILTFILFRKWRTDVKHKALFNLSLALFSFLLIFVVGVERREGSIGGCIAVAALLHYFMLASFAWMLIEAFMQYLLLVKVIGTYIPRFMQKAILFGWGVPVIIVGIILSINYNLYHSRHKYCWLSDKAFYYAVAGPVLAMLAMNFVIFALILYSNTCGRNEKYYLRTNRNERQETITRAKAVFCVSILLGLSWIFGFLAVDGAKLVFQYLFAVTTTLQGFFIFIFFVFRQKNTRDLWLSLITPTPTPEISHITAGTDTNSIRGLPDPNGQQQTRLSKAIFRTKSSYVSFNR